MERVNQMPDSFVSSYSNSMGTDCSQTRKEWMKTLVNFEKWLGVWEGKSH